MQQDEQHNQQQQQQQQQAQPPIEGTPASTPNDSNPMSIRAQNSNGAPRTSDADPKYFRAMNEAMTDGAFSMTIVPSEFRREAYEIFRKYQMTVHREAAKDCNEEAYYRFLVDSPLITERVPSDPGSGSVKDLWYGSFHVHYRLSGKLFAVGVVDLLPNSFSSVYLFYDPAFGKLSPGTLSALKEIEWVSRASYPTMYYYYMGYYIHSCPKMRYKVAFVPSELLCDDTKLWIPSTDALAVLDAAAPNAPNVTRLAPPGIPVGTEGRHFVLSDQMLDVLLGEALVEVNLEQSSTSSDRRSRTILSYKQLLSLLQPKSAESLRMFAAKIRQFIKLVGKSNSELFLHPI